MGGFLISCVAITSIFLSKSASYRYSLFLILLVCLTIDLSYKHINGGELLYDDLVMLGNASEYFGGAISLYFSVISSYFLLVLVFLYFSDLLLTKLLLLFIPTRVSAVLVLVSLFTSYLIIWNTNGYKSSFPSMFKLPALNAYSHLHGLYSGERNSISINPTVPSLFSHVILIVDESVRGDLLQINNSQLKTTPFLSSIATEKLINYGEASSATICSHSSNILLLSGLDRQAIPDIKRLSRSNPTLFQYARKAGFHTTFIDAQSISDKPDGYMTLDDNFYIDDNFQTKRLFPYSNSNEVDILSISVIDSIMQTHDKSFTYLIKEGSHFPYESSYPETHKIFSPTKDIISWDRKSKQLILNSYYNSLLWNVDHFWYKLDSVLLKHPDVLIIYTSDHGQNIFDHDRITASHCYKGKVPREMASVPLFIYSTDSLFISERKHMESINDNHLSHFDVFPTVLYSFGYEESGFHSITSNKCILTDTIKYTREFFSGDIYDRSPIYTNSFD